MPEGSRRQLPEGRCAIPLLDGSTARRQPKAHKPEGGGADAQRLNGPKAAEGNPNGARVLAQPEGD
eukprot:3715356-Alexandrium_andersonii.AAC.1